MNEQEYKTKFINHLTLQGIDLSVAENEYAAWIESYPGVLEEDGPQPEMDADECISYWRE